MFDNSAAYVIMYAPEMGELEQMYHWAAPMSLWDVPSSPREPGMHMVGALGCFPQASFYFTSLV